MCPADMKRMRGLSFGSDAATPPHELLIYDVPTWAACSSTCSLFCNQRLLKGQPVLEHERICRNCPQPITECAGADPGQDTRHTSFFPRRS